MESSLGVIPATMAVGLGSVGVGLLALQGVRERSDVDLDGLEDGAPAQRGKSVDAE